MMAPHTTIFVLYTVYCHILMYLLNGTLNYLYGHYQKSGVYLYRVNTCILHILVCFNSIQDLPLYTIVV